MEYLYGALTIATKVRSDPLPWFADETVEGERLQGNHVANAHNGSWQTMVNGAIKQDVYIPQRNKHIHVTAIGQTAKLASKKLIEGLPLLDAADRELSYSHKLDNMMLGFEGHDFGAVVNTESKPGTFILIGSGNIEMHAYLVLDNVSLQLHWTTESHYEDLLRSHNATRYMIYRLPPIRNRMIFVPSQIVSAKWWTWFNKFTVQDQHIGVMRSLSNLEYFLYGIRRTLT